MLIKITNHIENTSRVFEYPWTLSDFVKIHFAGFRFYHVEKTGSNVYRIFCDPDRVHLYTIQAR